MRHQHLGPLSFNGVFQILLLLHLKSLIMIIVNVTLCTLAFSDLLEYAIKADSLWSVTFDYQQ